MSTTTEPTPPGPAPAPTTPPIGPNDYATRPIETAPSQTMADLPNIARVIGFAGLFALVLGVVVIVLNMTLSPRWIGKGGGYLFSAFGIALMLYHAMRDGEPEVRRLYGMLAALWLVLGILAAVVPGPVFETALKKESGYNLLPGVGFGFLSLVFAIPFIRQETDPRYHDPAVLGLLGVGAALAVGSLLYGLYKPDFLVGPGIALALLGLGFLCAYMGQVDTSEGIGYRVAFILGAAGAGVMLFAIARSAVPSLLFEGPNSLRKASQVIDTWKAVGRGVLIALFAGIAAVGWLGKFPGWLRITLAAIGLAGVAVLAVASTTTVVNPMMTEMAQKAYLVPGGLILMGLGAVYLAVSLGICSDNQFITLTRRELASYIFSPIGHMVLGVIVLVLWAAYLFFVRRLTGAGRPIPEPIVQLFFIDFFPVLLLLFQVPILTMRLLSEEKRTGSVEVLLTAPVNEAPIVLSKFLATWIFFMVSWLPVGLFLVVLRVETDQPFDYRPLLSFYVALAAQGVAFLAIGLFFSALTRNQIVAAVLMLVVMMLFFGAYFLKDSPTMLGLPPVLQIAIGKLSYIDMWQESLAGKLPLRDVLLFVSMGVFFLFLSVKVLETRKWS